MAVHERFRAARLRQARTLAAIALQIGAREDWLRAIEDGRFGDLPSGLYGRATLRGYAKALGLNGDEMLADCESLLPALDDPIAGLARLKGLRPRDDRLPKPPSADSRPMAAPAHAAAQAHWSAMGVVIVAMAIDAFVIGGLLLVVIAATLGMCGVPPAALGSAAAPAFGLTASLLAATYFLVFGGIAAATPGERIMRRPIDAHDQETPATCRDIAARALRCAGRDVLAIVSFGEQFANWHWQWLASRSSRVGQA